MVPAHSLYVPLLGTSMVWYGGRMSTEHPPEDTVAPGEMGAAGEPTQPMPEAAAPTSPYAHPTPRDRRAWGCLVRILLAAVAVMVVCCGSSLLVARGGTASTAGCGSAPPRDTLLAGAAKADISPSAPVYLGGYGFGPVRRSTGVLHPLYVRALALRAPGGSAADTVVFAALDSQGYFAAYQSGLFGFDAIRAQIASSLDIPATHIILAATHSHAAPDTVGFWGGVPASYLALVRRQVVAAISQAVRALAPARLSVGASDVSDLERSFDGQASGWPVDTQLRVLHVTGDNGQTLATLVNVSIHPTALPASNTKADPDWPGVTATTLEQHLGGVSMVMVGALGHTWPLLKAATSQASADPDAAMEDYGAVIAARAISALPTAETVTNPRLCVADVRFRELDTTAPLLLALQLGGRSGHERILRSLSSPYYSPPLALGVEVEVVRVGGVVFAAAPVEAYPSLLFALRTQLHAPNMFFFGLAGDQLGYACAPGEWPGAVKSSPTDEALFIVNPRFGDDIVDALVRAARSIGTGG